MERSHGNAVQIKFLPLLAAAAAAVLAMTIVTGGKAGKGDIFDTDHDTGSPGNPTCAQCHIPHEAAGLYIWARVPVSPFSGDSRILPLCFSCHDGAVAVSGSYLPEAGHNHPLSAVTYDDDEDPGTPDIPVTDYYLYESDCRKCMEPDCIRCHDAHSDAWVFLDATRFASADTDNDGVGDLDFLNGSLCTSCHDPDSDDYGYRETHPEVSIEPKGADDFDPPSGADRSWDGDVQDFSGTRLWTNDRVYSSRQGAPDTAPYVVQSGAGDIRCMTCHTAHGAQNENLTAMASGGSADSHAPICENCHQ